jgi:hypothetical protein
LKSDFDIDSESRCCSTIIGRKFDTTMVVRAEESRTIGELGVRNQRRFLYFAGVVTHPCSITASRPLLIWPDEHR